MLLSDPERVLESSVAHYLPWRQVPEDKTLKLDFSLNIEVSMGELWSPVKTHAEVQDSVQERRSGRGDVERADPPVGGQRHELVA